MEKFLEKISSYNILNNLLPGSIFCYLLKIFYGIDIISESVVEILFLYYFIGMVISRVGSVVIEPIFIKLKIVIYADYSNYLMASKIDDKIEILLETNNTYRTVLSLFFVLIIIKLYIVFMRYYPILIEMSSLIIIITLFMLFAFSYRKQTNYIKARVEKTIKKEDK